MHRSGTVASCSIRGKIPLLLLLATVVAFGAIFWFYLLERSQEIESAEQISLLLAESLAAQQKQVEITTRGMLRRLVHSPAVQTLNEKECSTLLSNLNSRHPSYSILGLVTLDGNLIASSEPFKPGSINISNEKNVRDAIRSRNFSAGEYTVGRITGVRTIHYAYPVLDLSGHLIALAIAGFRLDRYEGLIDRANLPLGSVVVIADSKGTRLFRSPESKAAMLGQPISRETFKRMSGHLDEGVFEGIGGDGIHRIDAFKRLCLRKGFPPYLYIIVGVAKSQILQGPNLEFSSSLLVFGMTVLAALAIVWCFLNFPRKVD